MTSPPECGVNSGRPAAPDDGTPHFAVLDGLRGVAALLVVAFHIQGIAVLFDPAKLLLPHAYLAVDFFFALSGFVVGHAYDDRRAMTARAFLMRRCVRLHPLVLLGALLGLASYVADPFAGDRQQAAPWLIVAAFVAACLALPSPPLPNRLGDSHPLNAPAWTLLQEYLANLAYILVLRRLGVRALAVLAGIAAILSLATALSLGSYDTGWGLHNFWGAPVRLAYPFLAGLLIHRLRDRLPRRRLGFATLAILLALAFAAPVFPERGGLKLNGVYQAGCVLILFPAIIVAGRHSGGGPGLARLSQWAGRISYPLYITHYPFVYLYMNRVAMRTETHAMTVAIAVALYGFTILFALAADRWWDVPLRSWLRRRIGG
jgi:peptidoglycan/LPS O-acetylase OafA/YrhL